MIELADSTLFLALEGVVSGTGSVLLHVAALLLLAYALTMVLTLAISSRRPAGARLAGGSLAGERPAGDPLRLSLVRDQAVAAAQRSVPVAAQVSRAA